MNYRLWMQYLIALAISIIIVFFYWYARNMVCGYYELLWFRIIDDENLTTKILLIIPGLIFIGLWVYGIMRSRRMSKKTK